MALPLLDYRQTTQNQRVSGYEVPNEDTPRAYRLEECTDQADVEALIWASYRQVFSEHVILKHYRLNELESQLKNRAITVRDFIRGLAKSEVFHRLVWESNSNYRVVELSLKRLLGRSPYGNEETIAWSIVIATQGLDAFVDALIDSEEYTTSFGDNTVPYQRRRYGDRPFNLVTPRYADYWRDRLESQRFKWGDVQNFREMARAVAPAGMPYRTVRVSSIQIPDMTRTAPSRSTPASINSAANFPVA